MATERCRRPAPFVVCANGKHGGELALIPAPALSKLHLGAKERGEKKRKVRRVNRARKGIVMKEI